MNYELLETRTHAIASRIQQLGGDVQEVVVENPISEEQIFQMEKRLGVQLPESFKRVLQEFSGGFSFYWSLPEDLVTPHEFRDSVSSNFHWSIESLPRLEEERKEWVNQVFPNAEDKYDKIWHNKLVFCEVGNGDYIAFDLIDSLDEAPIIYLSHDDGEGHGYRLANTFIELIESWSSLGFVGCEDNQWLPFTMNSTSGILAEGETANRFKNWLGLNF
ncbi:SMI1/KNR4 family protein [Exiguobacterium sp. SL-10]|uniref:SMI1/KNR4 family protein n=1 Tax=unclassified Exiguobacterium TaxID=2644629 RepID=UPI0010401E16|nr:MULTISPECIES: SMI1/KNR4 family protein [unclassified Exiguobacterium]TCI22509.1 SMI1/KNR4 family protein [Exiguobacterium sp. SL-9]TCI30308.1 SMI1/KNR4 family protein [Exiguobacterium sp. SL-10]